MAKRPRFSVVIPTRNRAKLLGYAMRSSLSQSFEDFELVVVNNASSDGTAEVIAGFDDPRIRVVHSSQSRLMHDNWSFAVEQTRGEYVLFLCDDDAWHPRLLEIVDAALRESGADVVCWRSVTHYSSDWFEQSRRGTVNFGPPWSDRRFEIDPSAMLDAAFDMRITITDIVPRMLNTAISESLVQRLRERNVRLFRPCNPDYSCFIAMALHARGMGFLDAPLLVSGATPMSVGASATQRGDTARKFLDDLLEHEPQLVLLPPPRTQAHWIAQTFEQCRREIPSLNDRAVNWTHLYGLAGQEINRSAASGVDVSDWQSEFANLLAGPMAHLRHEIEAFAAGRRAVETDRYLTLMDDRPVLGTGSCFVPRHAHAADGSESIQSVAAGLDALIADDAQPIDALLRLVGERASNRTCVVYGLGLNGRALVRSLPNARPVSKRGPSPAKLKFASFDDGSDLDPPNAPRLRGPTALDPRQHFVVITPFEHHSISKRLAAQEFKPQIDMISLNDFAEARSHGQPLTAGAGSPSGCR